MSDFLKILRCKLWFQFIKEAIHYDIIIIIIKKITFNFFLTNVCKLLVAVVKPGKEHAGATLEIPSEEIIRKSG